MRPRLLVVLFLTACGSSSESVSKSDLEGQADSVNACCKIEGDEIGREFHLVRLGSKTVLVHDWVKKSDSPGEFVGFSITVSDGATAHYAVKAGTVKYPDSATTWSHPDGQAGHGISNVDFCDECDNPDGCDGGGGGGDDGGGGGEDQPPDDGGECTNPDGCDDGTGTVLL
jgi:hypothetical protein